MSEKKELWINKKEGSNKSHSINFKMSMIMFFYNVNLKNTANKWLMLGVRGNDIYIDIYRLMSIILIHPSSGVSSEKIYLILKE